MEAATIIEYIKDLISSVGFPIIAFFFMYKNNVEEGEKHAEESKAFADAIASNTEAVTRLATIIERMER